MKVIHDKEFILGKQSHIGEVVCGSVMPFQCDLRGIIAAVNL